MRILTFLSLLSLLVSVCNLLQKDSSQEGPYALRQGRQITLKSPALIFEIPQNWVDLYEAGGHNLHLSTAELQAIEGNNRMNEVINKVLPFKQCVFAAGGSGQKHKENRIFRSLTMSDVLMRVYILDESPELIERLLEETVAARNGKISTQTRNGTWHQTILATPTDARGYTRYIEFYFRRFETQTIGFVFIYFNDVSSPLKSKEETIEAILASVRGRGS